MKTVPLMVANWLLLITPIFGLDVPSEVKEYEPVLVKHEAGTKIQVLPWGTPVPQFLDEKNLARFDDHTVFCAPPGSYLVSGDGTLAILIIKRGNNPNPPDVPDPDDPDVPPSPQNDCSKIPEDRFNNIGKLACRTLSVLSQETRQRYQQKVKEAYLSTAKVMDNPNSGILTLNDGMKYLTDQLNKELGDNKEDWVRWATAVGLHIADLQIDRSSYADLCRAIAGGL